MLRDKLLRLGVRHVRDRFYNVKYMASPDSSFYRILRDLHTNGDVRFTLVASAGGGTDNTRAGLEKVHNWTGGGLEAIEGPNEPPTGTEVAVRSVMRELKSARDSSSLLKDAEVSLVAPAFVPRRNQWDTFVGGTITDNPSTWTFNPADYIDYGNAHPYLSGRQPTIQTYNHGSPSNLEKDLRMYSSGMAGLTFNGGRHRMVLTETGYHNALNHSGENPISELGESRYIGRLFAQYFNEGSARTFTYELFDQSGISGGEPVGSLSNPQNHYGLVRSDGSVKPAYTALQNLINLLNDRGTKFVPQPLSYALGVGDGTIRKLLLGKRDGSHWLAVWQHKSVWNVANRTDQSPADQVVTLTVPAGKTVTRYVPRTGTAGTPLAVANGSTTVSVPAEVILLRIA